MTADGRLLAEGRSGAAVGSSRISVLRITDGSNVRRFPTDSAACSLSFSEDGSWLAAGFKDGLIRFWDLRTE
jgi:WD40 repeat protein